MWQRGRGVPADERVDRGRQRVKVSAEPAEALGIVGIRGGPDVGALEVGPARVRIARALDEREITLFEDLFEAAQPGVQPERHPRRVTPDWQHLAGWNPDRGPPTPVKRIVVGNQHAERIVAAAQIKDDEVSGLRSLRACQVAQELRRCERDRKCRGATLDELTSGDLHTNWYSGRPAIRWTRPGALVCSWESLPVHGVVATR